MRFNYFFGGNEDGLMTEKRVTDEKKKSDDGDGLLCRLRRLLCIVYVYAKRMNWN